MNVSELKVRKGEPVRQAWARLVAWVESIKIVPSDDIELRITKHGTIVRVRDNQMFRHPFRVAASIDFIRLSSGTINGEVPLMKDADGTKRRIDNRDKEGARETKKSEPAMKLDKSKASTDGRIFVCAKVKPKMPGEKDGDEGTDATQEIVQTDSAKGPVDGYGYYPLAIIRLTKDRDAIDEVFQVVHHNIRYNFQQRNPTADDLKIDPESKPIGRYLFYPA
jgi:hypothetical protein